MNWPLLASPSRQLAGNPSAGRLEDQQGAHHSCHLRKLGQQRKDSVDDHRQALESTLFQGYQPRYAGRQLSRQCKGMDDPECLSTLAAGLWSPDARSPSPPFAGQLPGPHPLGEVCEDERGPSQHPRFLPAAKHDLGSPTLRCWDHTHIQSVLQKAIQQPTSGWLREQHRQSEKDQHSGCIPPSSPSLGGGCFAYHNHQLLPPLQNPDQRHHPHTTRPSDDILHFAH